MAKVFADINDQITLLKSKGLQISERFAKQILEKENYYNLINGYKSLFIDTSHLGQGEIFKKGTDFREIYALFLFDRELRSLFLRQILEIENNVRSVLSHDFAMKYGHDNYLKIDNFDKNPNTLGDVADLFSIIIIFKQILTKKNFSKFCVSLDKLIKKLLTSLHTITMDDVQNKMGLPVNWSQIKDI
jgi:hypothetical protein